MIVANVLGMLGYLWMAHYAWAIPAERAASISTTTSEPFIWTIGVLPVWALFLVINLAWAVAIVLRRPRTGAVALALVLAMWGAAYVVDYVHH
jgi:hypothetical protein